MPMVMSPGWSVGVGTAVGLILIKGGSSGSAQTTCRRLPNQRLILTMPQDYPRGAIYSTSMLLCGPLSQWLASNGDLEPDVDGEQVGAEDADVDGVERAQRVPGDDLPLAGEGALVRADGGDAVQPAVAQPHPEPDPHPGVVPDVVDPARAGAVLGDDPELVALAAVADRDPADLARDAPPGLQDRQPVGVDADQEEQSEQRGEQGAL